MDKNKALMDKIIQTINYLPLSKLIVNQLHSPITISLHQCVNLFVSLKAESFNIFNSYIDYSAAHMDIQKDAPSYPVAQTVFELLNELKPNCTRAANKLEIKFINNIIVDIYYNDKIINSDEYVFVYRDDNSHDFILANINDNNLIPKYISDKIIKYINHPIRNHSESEFDNLIYYPYKHTPVVTNNNIACGESFMELDSSNLELNVVTALAVLDVVQKYKESSVKHVVIVRDKMEGEEYMSAEEEADALAMGVLFFTQNQ